MENKFFSLIKPYLSYIDSGKLYKQPFRILYQAIAILMLLFPLAVLFQLLNTGFFKHATGGMIFGAILIWLVLAAAGCLSFQLWWNRAAQLKQTSTEGDDFVATPVLSNLIQTFGEWLGSYIAAVGFAVTLLALIFTNGNTGFIPGMGKGLGWLGLLLFPIYGFITVVLFRWFAEAMRALVAIANNTRK
ncbi:MAG: hypothetical protein J1E79_00995 [Rikenella sp.]|nr:hypothetical protein [Rikenella sp.]